MSGTYDDPIIFCTPHQLAWCAHQTACLIDPLHLFDNDENSDPVFVAWWNGLGVVRVSLRELCLVAWRNANPKLDDSDSRFVAWWQTIVDAQPIVENPQ